MRRKQDEKSLIGKIERAFGNKRGRSMVLALGDDAALWAETRGSELILTCDWFLEGTHFLREKHPADAVGWKCLARAVSDIAAMGGVPRCFLMSLALPESLTGKWLDGFLGGLRRASRTLRCELAGGDTTRGDEVLINIAVVGEVARSTALRRSGAKATDVLFVSGTLGEADLGLRELRQARGMARASNATLRKHLYPWPRLELGQWLAKNRLATAMMDLSDGLSTDLPRLCTASGVGAQIDAESLPLSSLTNAQDARKLALHGGDDYELLFSVAGKNLNSIPKVFRGLRLTRVGKITRQRKVLVTEGGRTLPLKPGGWDPFRIALPVKNERPASEG
jgi:thiamine-monophosphate kinase